MRQIWNLFAQACSIMVAWVKLYIFRAISIWAVKSLTREHMGMEEDPRLEKHSKNFYEILSGTRRYYLPLS